MARLITTGHEIDPQSSGTVDVGAVNNAVNISRETGIFRSGLASAKFDTTGANTTAYIQAASTTGGTFATAATAASKTYFARVYMYFANLPTSAAVAGIGWSATAGFEARLTLDGKLHLFNSVTNAQIGSDSTDTMVTGQWYRIEMKLITNGSTQGTDIELRLDGTTVASSSGLTTTLATELFTYGWVQNPSVSQVCYADDVAVNDSSGASNNSWPDSGKIVLMCPISDNARGAWVRDASATTNLFDAVNNTPPTGVADGSTVNGNNNQIKNKTTTNPTSYDGNLDTYTNAGISGTVNAIQVCECDGEDPGTGTKTGASSMVSNPAIAEAAAINFGDDSGAQGTYLGNWRWHGPAPSNAPAVTLGTAPVIRMRCISGATAARAASCCFLGAYVDYTPVTTRVPRSPGVDSGNAHL